MFFLFYFRRIAHCRKSYNLWLVYDIFSALPKNSLCSDSFVSTEKCSDILVYTRIYLKDENYILNYLKILGLSSLLKMFLINLLFKWGLVLIILSKRWIPVMIKFTDRKRSLYLKSFLILLLKVSIAFLSLLENCNMINMIF